MLFWGGMALLSIWLVFLDLCQPRLLPEPRQLYNVTSSWRTGSINLLRPSLDKPQVTFRLGYIKN